MEVDCTGVDIYMRWTGRFRYGYLGCCVVAQSGIWAWRICGHVVDMHQSVLHRLRLRVSTMVEDLDPVS